MNFYLNFGLIVLFHTNILAINTRFF